MIGGRIEKPIRKIDLIDVPSTKSYLMM